MVETAAAIPLVSEAEVGGAAALDALLAAAHGPVLLRGLARDWPLVAAGLGGARAASAYLLAHARDRDFDYAVGLPGSAGGLFYDAALAVNFRMAKARLGPLLAEIAAAQPGQAVYAGSLDIDQHFTGLSAANQIALGTREPMTQIWIGSASLVAAHNDYADNLAVCAVGQRRFTVFPPDQFANLYLSPFDNTPAGRAVSLVDHAAPDFARFPRYREALDHAQVAELGPGDALLIPSGWYHRVEASAPFNVLVNYWWRTSPRWLGQSEPALLHAILALRDLPAAERAMWRAMFEHYVFSGGADAAAHLPARARGVLGPLSPDSAGRLHSFLLRSLSR